MVRWGGFGRYEPFNLAAGEGIATFFDPRMLANYLVR